MLIENQYQPVRLSERFEKSLHDASERQRAKGKGGYTKQQIEAFEAGFHAGTEAKADQMQLEVTLRELQELERETFTRRAAA